MLPDEPEEDEEEEEKQAEVEEEEMFIPDYEDSEEDESWLQHTKKARITRTMDRSQVTVEVRVGLTRAQRETMRAEWAVAEKKLLEDGQAMFYGGMHVSVRPVTRHRGRRL